MDSVKRKFKNGGVSKIVTSTSITQANKRNTVLYVLVPSKPCLHQDLHKVLSEFSTDGGQDGGRFKVPSIVPTEHGVGRDYHDAFHLDNIILYFLDTFCLVLSLISLYALPLLANRESGFAA
jgi:hypothetical protein